MSLMQNLMIILLESAPWLLLGLLIAGLIKGLVPDLWMQKQLGGRSTWHVVKAAFIGAPLPLCSCGVVPAALGIRRAGASKGATISFLVSTPETGPDSITLSYALMGPFMAIIRPIAAITSGIVAGLLVQLSDKEVAQSDAMTSADKTEVKGSCCAQKESEISKKTIPIVQKLYQGVFYSFTKLLSDIAGWLVFGIAVAAIIQTFIPPQWFAEWGNGFSAMVLMAVIGVPMYICASASTPIAVGFLAAGVSPGAVLVFMLAGPATNIGTLGIIRKELGMRSVIGYLTGVIVVAFGFGFFTDYWLGLNPAFLPDSLHTHLHHDYTWLDKAFGVFMIAAIGFSWAHAKFKSAASQSELTKSA